MWRKGYTYILTNKNRTVFYIGVSSDLENRLEIHSEGLNKSSFTARCKVTDLVYYEEHENIMDAIDREKQLKNWKREWKIELIKSVNPEMKNLEDEL
jgi:putative endonuclease